MGTLSLGRCVGGCIEADQRDIELPASSELSLSKLPQPGKQFLNDGSSVFHCPSPTGSHHRNRQKVIGPLKEGLGLFFHERIRSRFQELNRTVNVPRDVFPRATNQAEPGPGGLRPSWLKPSLNASSFRKWLSFTRPLVTFGNPLVSGTRSFVAGDKPCIAGELSNVGACNEDVTWHVNSIVG